MPLGRGPLSTIPEQGFKQNPLSGKVYKFALMKENVHRGALLSPDSGLFLR